MSHDDDCDDADKYFKAFVFDFLHFNAPSIFIRTLSSATTSCFYIVPEMCQGVPFWGLWSLEYDRETLRFGGYQLIICFHLINSWMSSIKTRNT